jgi:dTDP-4-amino-4,6-dideoxygalactose transaminase
MVVHEFGYPVRIAEIAEICRHNNLLLIEDAACAFGTVADGKHPGFYGDIACFSFHPRKAITTGEGGAILTRRKDLADRIASLRTHGIVRTADGMDFQDAGLNCRLTDFQAALALGQIDRFGAELARRRELVATYQHELRDVSSLTLPEIPDGHSLQSFMVMLAARFSRKDVMASLLESGIQANLNTGAINCLAYYQRKYGLNENSCPVATRLYRSGLVLPLYGAMTTDDVERICGRLRESLKETGR